MKEELQENKNEGTPFKKRLTEKDNAKSLKAVGNGVKEESREYENDNIAYAAIGYYEQKE